MHRWMLLFLVGCASPSPPLHQVKPTPPPINAEKLERGKPVEKSIRKDESHRYRIDAGAAMVVKGVVMQNGIDVAVHTYSPNGKHLAEIDGPNGNDVEVRPFVDPCPGVSPNAASKSLMK